MKKVGFSDWQEMALKKDVEDIKRTLNSQEPILFSLCWELAIALGSIIVDHLFDISKTPVWVWIVIIICAIIPIGVIIGNKITLWVFSIHRAKKGNLMIKEYIDIFDNQLSYWVMLSNSYADMLTKAVKDGHSTKAEKEFLYREGCYYNNKSMQALYGMKSNFNKIFSLDIKEIKKKNLIDLARLHNLLMVMNEQQVQLDSDIEGINSEGISLQKELNAHYLQELNDFLRDVNGVFSSYVYCWDITLNKENEK